jgi:hypothetical protein
MVIVHVVPAIVFLFGYGNTVLGTSETSRSLRAENNKAIIYHEGLGPDSILMARYPTSCTVSNTSTSTCYPSTTAFNGSIESTASSPRTIMPSTSTSFNTPPIFGAKIEQP